MCVCVCVRLYLLINENGLLKLAENFNINRAFTLYNYTEPVFQRKQFVSCKIYNAFGKSLCT